MCIQITFTCGLIYYSNIKIQYFFFLQKRLGFMFRDNFTFVTVHGFLGHWLDPSTAIFCFPSQTKVLF